jgi:hypothetical protein
MNNSPLDRLHELADLLAEHLEDAESIRARFKKARDANVWPDLHPIPVRPVADLPPLPYFVWREPGVAVLCGLIRPFAMRESPPKPHLTAPQRLALDLRVAESFSAPHSRDVSVTADA